MGALIGKSMESFKTGATAGRAYIFVYSVFSKV
jgi:hypothetical protein